LQRYSHVVQMVLASHRTGLSLCFGESRKQQSRQDPDDCDDYQQLDQGETSSMK
jgi:hypothetical protein